MSYQLLHQWRFENNGNDSIGSNNCSIAGGYADGSIRGSTKCLDVNSGANGGSLNDVFLGDVAKFSISFWINSSNNNVTFPSNLFTVNIPGHSLYLQNQIDGTILFNFNSIWLGFFLIKPLLTINTWHNIIFVVDNSLSRIERCKCYIDNNEVSIGIYTDSDASPITNTTAFNITTLSSYKIDDFRLYSGPIDINERSRIQLGENLTPILSSITPSSKIKKGKSVILSGNNLLAQSSTVLIINGFDYSSFIKNSNNNSLIFIAPDLLNGEYDINVIIDGLVSNSLIITYSDENSLIFSLSPNMLNGIEEKYEFLTDILISWNNSEQRIQLIENPRKSIKFNIMSENIIESAFIQNILNAIGENLIYVPWWSEIYSLNEKININDTVILIDASQGNISVGDSIIIWKNYLIFETFLVIGKNNSFITINDPIKQNYNIGEAIVLPLKLCRTNTSQIIDFYNREYNQCSITFYEEKII